MIKENVAFTLIATSNWCAPEVHKHLSESQAKDLAWEYKNQQYQVTIEREDSLAEIGICRPID